MASSQLRFGPAAGVPDAQHFDVTRVDGIVNKVPRASEKQPTNVSELGIQGLCSDVGLFEQEAKCLAQLLP